jgi:tryptophan 7-halogenase
LARAGEKGVGMTAGEDSSERAAARPVRRVVVVGGGTAGWLAACRLAAAAAPAAGLQVTLVESPDVPTIGVGEGTWPTMRATLERIGLSEPEFLLASDAAFKQGSRFVGWASGAAGDAYLHPFTAPLDGADDAVRAWAALAPGLGFAEATGPQAAVCAAGLAPRQRAMPDYAGALNYAYHLDAGRFAALLARHGVERLGVRHVRDHVEGVERAPDGDIAAVRTRANGAIEGDLFLDCTGQAALLIGQALGVGFVDCGEVLPNDRALAVQAPVVPGSAVASQTDATAHAAGWIWDIGLPGRRGIGCVYASAFMDDDAAAATLARYLADAGLAPAAPPRRLAFRSGYRERFWERNCLAVGLSAGFLEPLEASAIVLVELSLDALVEGFPAARAGMAGLAGRFNARFRYRWERIVEFLKLHYVLSRRDEPYWRRHRAAETVPPRLAELLALWRDRPPGRADLPMADEVFPAASWQYVLYGMGWPAPAAPAVRDGRVEALAPQLAQARHKARALAAGLPTNRAYLDALAAASLPAALEQVS